MFDSNQNNTYGGYVYNPQMNGQPMQTKQPSTLSQEEYDRLVKQGTPFTLTLSELEVLRGICNHRDRSGTKDTLVQDANGTFHCTTCGWDFNPISSQTSEEDIKEAVTLVTDILQTIKLLYIDMPVQAQREYFQIIPLLGKIPELFKIAVNDFGRHESGDPWNFRNQNMSTMNLFNMLTGAMNNGFTGNMNYYNPNMMNNAYQQPQFNGYAPQQVDPNAMGNIYGQPMGNPAFNGYAPQQTVNPNMPVGSTPPMSNGFGYAGGIPPMGGYTPQTNQYQYTPQAQPQSTPGTTAPTEVQATTDGKTVTTQATFKA